MTNDPAPATVPDKEADLPAATTVWPAATVRVPPVWMRLPVRLKLVFAVIVVVAPLSERFATVTTAPAPSVNAPAPTETWPVPPSVPEITSVPFRVMMSGLVTITVAPAASTSEPLTVNEPVSNNV